MVVQKTWQRHLKKFIGFRLSLVAALLIGASLGTGAAFAHVAAEYMEEGSAVSGPHTHETVDDYDGFPDFEYTVDHVVWADADAPDATEFTVHDTYYHDGSSSEPDIVKFGTANFYNSNGDNMYSSLFYCYRVDGIDARKISLWDNDGYEEGDIATIDQRIHKTTSASACGAVDYKVHTEAWYND